MTKSAELPRTNRYLNFVLPYEPESTAHREAKRRHEETKEWLRRFEHVEAPPLSFEEAARETVDIFSHQVRRTSSLAPNNQAFRRLEKKPDEILTLDTGAALCPDWNWGTVEWAMVNSFVEKDRVRFVSMKELIEPSKNSGVVAKIIPLAFAVLGLWKLVDIIAVGLR